MKFKEKTIQAKDGTSWVLRNVYPSDAQSMIDYLRQVSGETPFLLRSPEEVNFTLEGEEALLQNRLEEEGGFMMLAERDGVIAGNCSLGMKGGAMRVRHRGSFAIALKEEFWNLGLGRAMISYALELGQECGYSQVELEVVEGNDRARALYEKVGFVQTGVCPNALKYPDGSIRDEYYMVKIF